MISTSDSTSADPMPYGKERAELSVLQILQKSHSNNHNCVRIWNLEAVFRLSSWIWIARGRSILCSGSDKYQWLILVSISVRIELNHLC